VLFFSWTKLILDQFFYLRWVFWVLVVQTARKIYKESCLKNIKMLGLFGHKKRVEKLRSEVQDSFNHVKKDFNKVGEWIKHLDDKHNSHKNEIDKINDQLLSIQNDLAELKDFVSFFGPQISSALSKQSSHGVIKQPTPVYVQTPVQTPVQTDILDHLTVMERAIVWALLNADMRLSYEDLAERLGKDKSTNRGQINSIKQKNEGLIEEYREVNGKKRLFIPENMRSLVIKSVKVKVKGSKSKK